MHTLGSVVRDHGSVLLLDTATTRIQVGLFQADATPRWATGGDDAGVHLFECAARLFTDSGLRPTRIGAFVLCDGPGSQLGIRTACMALRTWQQLRESPAPVFGYRSLHVAAEAEARRRPAPFLVISDARRDSWHALKVSPEGSVGAIERISTDELSHRSEPLLQPEGFRSWSKAPRETATIGYDGAALWRELMDRPLLAELGEILPWQSSTIAYQPWTRERHRGPVAQQSAVQQ